MTPEEAVLITKSELGEEPFFNPFDNKKICGHNDSAEARKPEVRAQLLAEAIPALSFAAGANPAPKAFGASGNVDFKIFQTHGWPEVRKNDDKKQERWLHGDLVDIAYSYIYEFYDDIVGRMEQ